MNFKKAIIVFIAAAFFMNFYGCSSVPVDQPLVKPVEPETTDEGSKIVETAEVFLPVDFIPQAEIDYSQYEDTPPQVVPVKAKGIYVSTAVSVTPSIFEERLKLCQDTEINAMVIDIKESDGELMFEGIEAVDEIGVSHSYIKDIKGFLKNLEDNDVYTIGRIVTFKDDAVIESHPDFALRYKNGTVFREGKGPAWLNPYNRDVWAYIAEIAKGAAEMGFKEIQFDYFRFPTTLKIDELQFGDTGDLSKEEIIAECGRYMAEKLKPYGVKTSVDVYGTIILSDLDASIVGQNYVELCKIFDYVCPMLYPSHFANNTMEIDYPDLHPYDTIYRSLIKSNDLLEGEDGVTAKIRPWLQDFTAKYLKVNYQEYGKDQIREQIQACYDAGIDEWLLWSSGSKNTAEALLPEAE